MKRSLLISIAFAVTVTLGSCTSSQSLKGTHATKVKVSPRVAPLERVVHHSAPVPRRAVVLPSVPRHAVSVVRPTYHAPASSSLWYLWTHTGYQPGPSDPVTYKLRPSFQRIFTCIRYYESRGHLVDGEIQQGAYQFDHATWAFGASHLGIETRGANYATGPQQGAVAVFYIQRNASFRVQWLADFGVCASVGIY